MRAHQTLGRPTELIPERQCTLYGTAEWERLTPHQRVALRQLETANVADTAWRLAADLPAPWLAGLWGTDGPAHCGAVLLGQEFTHAYLAGLPGHGQPGEDAPPRDWAVHGDIARAALLRAVAASSRGQLRRERSLLAHAAFRLSRSLAEAGTYAQLGLEPRGAVRAAVANPYHQEAVCRAGERPLAFLREAGLIGGAGTRWWQRSFLLR